MNADAIVCLVADAIRKDAIGALPSMIAEAACLEAIFPTAKIKLPDPLPMAAHPNEAQLDQIRLKRAQALAVFRDPDAGLDRLNQKVAALRQCIAGLSGPASVDHDPAATAKAQMAMQKQPLAPPGAEHSPPPHPPESGPLPSDIANSGPPSCGCGGAIQIPDHIRQAHTARLDGILGNLLECPPIECGLEERTRNPLAIGAVLEMPCREICVVCGLPQDGKGAAS